MDTEPIAPTIAALDDATTREEISRLLLDYAQGFAPRAVLLVVRGGALHPTDGRGTGTRLLKGSRVVLPLAPASVFSEVLASGQPYRGPLRASPVERGWGERLGGVGGEILLAPILAGDRTVAILWLDGWSGALPDAPLYAATAAAGRGYARMILARKRRSPHDAAASSRPASAAEGTGGSQSTSRSDPRYAIAIGCAIVHDGATLRGESRDLSSGGLCVHAAARLPVGATVVLELSLILGQGGVSEAIRLPARVVWCTALPDGSHQIGARFVDLGRDAQANLDLFIRFLDAAPGTDDGIDADEAPFV